MSEVGKRVRLLVLGSFSLPGKAKLVRVLWRSSSSMGHLSDGGVGVVEQEGGELLLDGGAGGSAWLPIGGAREDES
jgi:hypothetical protein